MFYLQTCLNLLNQTSPKYLHFSSIANIPQLTTISNLYICSKKCFTFQNLQPAYTFSLNWPLKTHRFLSTYIFKNFTFFNSLPENFKAYYHKLIFIKNQLPSSAIKQCRNQIIENTGVLSNIKAHWEESARTLLVCINHMYRERAGCSQVVQKKLLYAAKDCWHVGPVCALALDRSVSVLLFEHQRRCSYSNSVNCNQSCSHYSRSTYGENSKNSRSPILVRSRFLIKIMECDKQFVWWSFCSITPSPIFQWWPLTLNFVCMRAFVSYKQKWMFISKVIQFEHDGVFSLHSSWCLIV